LHFKNRHIVLRPFNSSVQSPGFSSALFAWALLLASSLFLAGCSGSQAAKSLQVTGAVHGGQQPVTGSAIQLHAVGTTGDGSAATPLISSTVTTSDGSGNAANSNANAGNNFNALPAGSFTITGAYTCPSGSTQVYLVATGGNPGLATGTNNPALALMAALGSCSNLSSSTFISVNELTTVGAIAALNNFTSSYSSIGSGSSDAPALQSAFNLANEYTNTTLGSAPGPSLPFSYYASSIEIQTLANALSACVNSDGTNCSALFTDATPSGQPAPTDTIGAALNIINNPALNVCAIYSLVPSSPPFQPTLSSCPSSWTLPISPLTVTVTGPSSVTIGQTAQYGAAVGATGRGATNQSVTWSVNGVAGGNSTTGTISAAGLYTPPSTAPGAITISAVSTLSSAASGSLSVSIVPISVAVTGLANVLFSQAGQYSAVATGTTNQNFIWIVDGVAGGSSVEGTISAGGLYMAPATTPIFPVVVTAQSTDPSQPTGSLSVTISAAAATYATGDSRTVTQPIYPAACQALSAQFNTSQRSSPPASDDTSRLQAALTACKNTGQSVELTSSGTSNAFYSAELSVVGEGLIIDSGVTLEGNNAYATQSELLNVSGTNSSIMGPGIVDGRGDILTGGTPRIVQTTNANNFIAYNVTLQQAAHPNLYIEGGNGATVWGVTILTPATRANADGIDVDSITNATVINSVIEAGDDGVAIKTNSAAASNITIASNKLYGTHGISIGSQTYRGVSNILFSNNYLYGTDLVGNLSADPQGVNIKTDPTCGGTVQQVTYQNTCLYGIKHLIVLNTAYGACSGTPGTPVFTDIVVNGVVSQNSVSGAYTLINGVNSPTPINGYFANINLDNTSQNSSNSNAAIALDNSNMTPSGTGITTSSFSTGGSVPTCSF